MTKKKFAKEEPQAEGLRGAKLQLLLQYAPLMDKMDIPRYLRSPVSFDQDFPAAEDTRRWLSSLIAEESVSWGIDAIGQLTQIMTELELLQADDRMLKNIGSAINRVAILCLRHMETTHFILERISLFPESE